MPNGGATDAYRSPLTREAWIEIGSNALRRSIAVCRLSHERRGLKSKYPFTRMLQALSPLTREAWIEINAISKEE